MPHRFPPASSVASDSPNIPNLEIHARAVLIEIQDSLNSALSHFRAAARRPRDLSRRLNIHQTLAWKIVRIARGQDLFADVQYIPGGAGMDIFLNAASECGVPAAHLADVRTAFARFHQLIDLHAGDRTCLEQMLSGLADHARAQTDSRPFRKAAFRCDSSTWGTQIRARLLSKILHPSPDGQSMDIALVRGFVGMRRIRPGAPLTLARIVVLDNDGKARRPIQSRPLDPLDYATPAPTGVPLIRQFCSHPLPQIRLVPGPDGVSEQQLGQAPIGEAAACTVFSGEVQDAAASRFRDQHNTVSNTAVSIRAPIEVIVIDLWAHHSLFPDAEPLALLYGETCGTPWYKQHPASAERLPLVEQVRTIGRGLSRARLSDVTECVDVMRLAFHRLGWNAEDFVLHRLRIDYPVISTAVVLQIPLPTG